MLHEDHVMQNTWRFSRPASIIATIINLSFLLYILKWDVIWGCPYRKTYTLFHLPNVWGNENMWKTSAEKNIVTYAWCWHPLRELVQKDFSETDVVIVIGYISLLISKSVEVFLKRQFHWQNLLVYIIS